MNKIDKVKEFHLVFDQYIGKIDELEPLKVRQLRIKLLFEELYELAEAGDVELTFHNLCESRLEKNKEKYGSDIGKYISLQPLHDGDNVNKKEELDALADIEYVLQGKVLTSGLYEKDAFNRAFDLIHDNNLSKAHLNKEHVLETIERKGLILSECIIKEKDGMFLLYNKDTKLIKPYDHKKVELVL